MKNIIYILITSLIISSCGNSTKLMQSGRYDDAISVSVRKLKKKNQKEKEILALEESYRKANDRDKEKINYLKKEGNPDNWTKIYEVFNIMKGRQERVKPLLPLYIESQKRNATFEIVNYDDEIINAKQNAAQYMYAHAMQLLDKNNKTDARAAYNELQQVKSFYNNYKDVDSQINRARNMGTSYVLFKMQNNTGVPLPPSFEEELYKISLTDLNADWIQYHTHKNKDMNYDYTILVNIKNILVSPESQREIDYQETKTVPDGFTYLLDSHGNVRKDSLGNDIKVPKTKVISCSVQEMYQNKKATIAGTLDYINNGNNQLIKTDPIAADNLWEWRSATAIGDLNALKPETSQKIGKRPAPFPPSFDMLLQAGATLKGMVKNIILQNKGVIY
jgi:hypothetical protein